MRRWVFGWELIQEKEWTPTELLNHIKNGLPAYDCHTYQRIYDLDTLPRHKKTLEEIKQEEEKKRKKAEKWAGPCKPLPDKLIALMFEKQKGTAIIPPGHEAMSFTLPTGKADILKLFDQIKLFLFRRAEVADAEQVQGKKKKAPQTGPAIATTESLNHYIQRRRREKTPEEIIAFELKDKKGSFKQSYLEIARNLGLNKDLQPNQIDALKQRARRACIKGKSMLAKNRKA